MQTIWRTLRVLTGSLNRRVCWFKLLILFLAGVIQYVLYKLLQDLKQRSVSTLALKRSISSDVVTLMDSNASFASLFLSIPEYIIRLNA